MSGAVPRGLAPGANHRNAKICSVCLSTPFDRLPAEEEAAYPHHTSLQSLRASARSCPLCALLVEAIDDEEQRLKDEKHRSGVLLGDFAAALQDEQHGFSNPVVGYVESIEQFQDIRLCRSSEKKILTVRDIGREQSATFENVQLSKYGAALGSPIRQPRQQRRQSDATPHPRPWVYGNWWLLDQPDGSLEPVRQEDFFLPQLIGIGVRVTEMPTPHACKMYDRDVVHLRGSTLRVFTELGDPAAPYIPGRIREMYDGSLKARDIIRFWINNCNRGHNCHEKEPPVLPTRVLDLGPTPGVQPVRLWDTRGAKGQYLALSHSWGRGGKTILTTTQATLRRHAEVGIPLNALPQTFLDAITIAAGLQIRYVWIDSLCIIQDSVSDWEREAPTMASVYRFAWLTVSASHALDATEGCFPRWRMFEYIPTETRSTGTLQTWNHLNYVPVQSSTSFRRRSQLFFHKSWMPPSAAAEPTVYRTGNFGKSYDPIASEPLSSRAWTLQERLLSARVLHFGRDQMYWQCGRCFAAEDGSRFDPGIFSLERVTTANAGGPTGANDAPFISFVPEARVPPADTRFKGGWLQVVADYSRRRLTYPEDKLPALSGLAGIIASRTGDEYLCGLWKRHIYQDLCWRVDVSPDAELEMKLWDMRMEPDKDINTPGAKELEIVFRDNSKPLERKRVPGRAPSWSWASMDAPVQFEPIQSDRVVAKLLTHEIVPSGTDKFGRVSSGFLVLQAPLLPIERRDLGASSEWMRISFDSKHPASDTPVQVRRGDEIAAGFATFDVDHDDDGSFPLCYALFVDSAFALVLCATTGRQQAGEYRRLGLARFIQTKSQANESVLGEKEVVYSSHKQMQGPVRADDPLSVVRIV